MNTVSIIIIRPDVLSSSQGNKTVFLNSAVHGTGPKECAVNLFCICVEPQGPGRIVNRTVSLPGLSVDWGHAVGLVCQAFKRLADKYRASRVIIEPGVQDLFKPFNDVVQNLEQAVPGTGMQILDVGSRVMDADPWLPLELLAAYNQIKTLPGTPLWQLVRYADTLDLFLGAMAERGWEKKKAALHLSRVRVKEDLSRLWVLGDHLEYHFVPPSGISPDLMEDIVRMVGAGGSVDITHVRGNLETAYLIGYVMENGVIVGDSSLKHPRQAFVDRVKSFTGLDFTGCVERGYTSVRPEYRSLGIGTRLLEGLTARAKDVMVYAIIDEKNIAAQKMAIHNNTRKIAAYFSEKVQKTMGVWMPDKMADAFLHRHKGDLNP